MRLLVPLVALATTANAFFLFGMKNVLTTERIDPIISPDIQASHAHAVFGGSNFRLSTNSASLRQSTCTTSPINEDKSAYWYPNLYFQWKNGSFTSVISSAVIYYLFYPKHKTTAFPDDFRMISGDPFLRSYDANSAAQKAITFLCLDYTGKHVTYDGLPPTPCHDGIRAQVNFPSCWNGKDVDSPDHKSHVAFRSEGPDRGDCTDPKYPVNLPRIFIEGYLSTQDFNSVWDQAMNPNQPFVFSSGDPTGYGFHGDFINGWAPNILQNVVDNCVCDEMFGDAQCCVNKGLFTLQKEGEKIDCLITKQFDEQILGTLDKLPGNNPVQPASTRANALPNDVVPARIEPIFVYTDRNKGPTETGKVVAPGSSPTPSSAPNASPTPAQVQKAPDAVSSPSPTPTKPPTTPEKSAPQPAPDKVVPPGSQPPKSLTQATPTAPAKPEDTPTTTTRSFPPCMYSPPPPPPPPPGAAKRDNHHHRRKVRRVHNAGHGDFLLV